MLRMAKRYGCKYPDVFLAVLFAVLIVSTTGYCSFAYAEDSGGGLEPTQEEVDELTARINAKPIYTHKEDGKTEGTIVESKSRAAYSGTYPTYKGTILVTSDKFKGLVPTGNDWNTSKGTAYGADVRGTTSLQDQAASNWCFDQVGKPYNYNYLDTATRSKFYCSQLVWAAFKDNYGIDINTDFAGAAIYPMEILDSPNVNVIYRKG